VAGSYEGGRQISIKGGEFLLLAERLIASQGHCSVELISYNIKPFLQKLSPSLYW
jgi:hypothetical protein